MVNVVSATLPEQAVARLRARSDVEYVEEDVVLYAFAQTLVWGVDRIDADLAWPAGNTGQGVKVAVLDTGVACDHPDLLVAGGVNFTGIKDGSTQPADWKDNHGHGTHCAGILAARKHGTASSGVAPDRSPMPSWYSRRRLRLHSDVIRTRMCATNGVKVASLSLGGTSSTSLSTPCARLCTGRHDRGRGGQPPAGR
jgi:subtilisin